MSAELKQLIIQFEDERDSVIAFVDEVNKEVASGKLTPDMGKAIIEREFEGRDPNEIIRGLNEHLASTRALLSTSSPKPKVAAIVPIAIVVVLVAMVAINFGAITGLFTLGEDESFYAINLDRSITASSTIPLDIADPLSSFRLDGTASGPGTVKAYLHLGNAKLLIAAYDGSEVDEASGLTGRVTDSVDDLPAETPTEQNPEEVALDATPQLDTPDVTEVTPPGRSPSAPAVFENACVETCLLPSATAATELEIEVTGEVEFTLNRVLYGTRGQPVTEVIPDTPLPVIPSNTTNETNTSVVPPVVTPPQTTGANATNETNSTNVTSTPPITTPPVTAPPVAAPPVVTPPVPPAASTGTLALGTACTESSECVSGVCLTSHYHGELTGGVCAASRVACVADTTVYQPGAQLDDSVCIASSSAATWLVGSGRGRFVVKNTAGAPAAAIDKYGTMVVGGTAAFSTTPGSSGWLIKDSADTVTLSIDETGTLRSAGTLTTLTSPQRTAAGDFVIRTAAGADAAVITQTGDVMLRGEFLSGASLQ